MVFEFDGSYGCLRKLELDDCDGMFEWMHDDDISDVFIKDFRNLTHDDVCEFIDHAYDDSSALHMAIVNEVNEYMGTISLKNIDVVNSNAEYAISTRSKAHGTGLAKLATKNILEIAFNEIGLNKVYLSVKATNHRAISFYIKCGFFQEGRFLQQVFEKGTFVDLLWFGMTRDDYFRVQL